LRFLDFLIENSIKLKVDKLMLNVPHPAGFALQKLIISSRRMKKEKGIKERQEAIRIMNCLIAKGEEGITGLSLFCYGICAMVANY